VSAVLNATVRPLHTQAINAERVHILTKNADAAGYHRGYREGFTHGARWKRLYAFGGGTMFGSALVVAALRLGLLAGA
jgi:hypothetical protein